MTLRRAGQLHDGTTGMTQFLSGYRSVGYVYRSVGFRRRRSFGRLPPETVRGPLMRAAATVVAATAREVLVSGSATEFKGLGNILPYRLLHLLHLLLGIEESASHGITDENVAVLLEIADFLFAQGESQLLFLLKHLALFHNRLVLRLCLFVIHELVDLPADGLEFRLGDNRLAKLAGLLDHSGFFGSCCHNLSVRRIYGAQITRLIPSHVGANSNPGLERLKPKTHLICALCNLASPHVRHADCSRRPQEPARH